MRSWSSRAQQIHCTSPSLSLSLSLSPSELGSQQLQASWQRQQTLHSDGERVTQTCQHTIASTAQAVEQKISVAMKDIVSQLSAIADR